MALPAPLLVRTGLAAGVVLGLALTVLVEVTEPFGEGEGGGDVLVASVRSPSALVPLDDGGLLYAERGTGRIRRVSSEGEVEQEDVATVDTDGEQGQRGLLGLAVRGDEVYAAYTRADDDRLVVARVDGVDGDEGDGEEAQLVWEGTTSANGANGGRLAVAPDGGLVLGTGDVYERLADQDLEAPAGRLLLLDPEAGPDQEPEVLSEGWNNPFAFTFTPGGALWAADNSPDDGPERIARGDTGGAPGDVTELAGDERVAPTGLAALSEDRLVLCGFTAEEVRFLDVSAVPARTVGEPVEGCTVAVAVLADGRLAFADEDTIRVTEVEDEG